MVFSLVVSVQTIVWFISGSLTFAVIVGLPMIFVLAGPIYGFLYFAMAGLMIGFNIWMVGDRYASSQQEEQVEVTEPPLPRTRSRSKLLIIAKGIVDGSGKRNDTR